MCECWCSVDMVVGLVFVLLLLGLFVGVELCMDVVLVFG